MKRRSKAHILRKIRRIALIEDIDPPIPWARMGPLLRLLFAYHDRLPPYLPTTKGQQHARSQ